MSFLLVIGPLIFVHELGHYFVGRWFGVKAEAFSIGFGREIAGWTDRRGTRWKLGWLPLGGYVKFAGDMNPASHAIRRMAARCRRRSARETFQAKPLWQRFLIVAAGPLTNFLFAILVYHRRFRDATASPRTPPVVAGVAAGLRGRQRRVRSRATGSCDRRRGRQPLRGYRRVRARSARANGSLRRSSARGETADV